MTGQTGGGPLRSAKTPTQQRAGDLHLVLGETTEDDRGEEQHGLLWWYPQVKRWPTVRSVGGAAAPGGKASLPLNAEAFDFLGGHYWVGEKSQDRCSHAELMDEENYRLGFEPTVIELEKSVRRALGQSPPTPLRRAADPLHPIPAVVAGLEHLVAMAESIAINPLLYELVHAEAVRLIVRARGMMHGSRFSAGRSQCMYCHLPESVISDEDRAVCINPFCRDEDGGRRCWRMSPVDASGRPAPGAQWIEVTEPDIRGRGQVSDDDLSRWADAG